MKTAKCKVCGRKLRAAKSGYCSFECLSKKKNCEDCGLDKPLYQQRPNIWLCAPCARLADMKEYTDEYPTKEHKKWCEDPACPCRSL